MAEALSSDLEFTHVSFKLRFLKFIGALRPHLPECEGQLLKPRDLGKFTKVMKMGYPRQPFNF